MTLCVYISALYDWPLTTYIVIRNNHIPNMLLVLLHQDVTLDTIIGRSSSFDENFFIGIVIGTDAVHVRREVGMPPMARWWLRIQVDDWR